IDGWYNPIWKVSCALIVAAGVLAAPLGVETAAAQAPLSPVGGPNLDPSHVAAKTDGPFTGKGIKVAVIDSGADMEHPLLKDRIVKAHDFVESDEYPQDEKGHGTHVAGIVAQQAPGASLLIYRAVAPEGHEFTSTIAEAMQRAIEDG
ncbi:S8 family serine peptidase, partial [Enterobacter quasiroggenkampii]|nr:S8 family serine peptidase [Enterobacter quasiroggenkampii]